MAGGKRGRVTLPQEVKGHEREARSKFLRGSPIAAGSVRPSDIYHVGRAFSSLAVGLAIWGRAACEKAKLRDSHDEQTLISGE